MLKENVNTQHLRRRLMSAEDFLIIVILIASSTIVTNLNIEYARDEVIAECGVNNGNRH